MAHEHEPLDTRALMLSSYPVSPFLDPSEGSGFHLVLGENEVDVFPTSRIVRVQNPDDGVRIGPVTNIIFQDGLFAANAEDERHRSALRVDPQSLLYVHTNLHLQDLIQPAEPPGVDTSETLAPTGEPTVDTPRDPEKDRVSLTGRIGYKPKFRTTPKGTLVGQFSVATHKQPGETTWHSVVTFGDRAQKLQESDLGRGDEVEVIGYLHERERKNPKTGEGTIVTEIYAAAVKKPKAKD